MYHRANIGREEEIANAIGNQRARETSTPKAAKPPASFTLDGRIELKIDIELAGCLSAQLLEHEIDNPALLALAHQIKNMVG